MTTRPVFRTCAAAPVFRAAAYSIVERLERRALLSVQLVDRTLLIKGTGADDLIDLTTDGSMITVHQSHGPTRRFTSSAIDRIDIDAKNGNDTVTVADEITQPATLHGGKGDDCLKGGGGDDWFIADPGNDTLHGGGGQYTGGLNTVDYSARSADISIRDRDLTTAAGEHDRLSSNLQTLLTGSGDDQIITYGTSNPGDVQYIDAGAGDDVVELFAPHHDSTVHGGDGNDDILMRTSQRTSYYFGDAGDDYFRVYRSSFTQRIFHGGEGIDTLDWSGFMSWPYSVTCTLDDVANDGTTPEWRYGAGPDNAHSDIERIIGNSGNDTIVGTDKDETILGSWGADLIIGGGGHDSIDGGTGMDNDLLIGETGDDTLVGGPGSDTLIGGTGANLLVSDDLDRIFDQPLLLIGGLLVAQGDNLDDVIQIARKPTDPSQVDVRLNGQSSEFTADDISRILIIADMGNNTIGIDDGLGIPTTILGGDGNDTIAGSGGGGDHDLNWTSARGGNDHITGGGAGGYDIIDAGAGDDLVQGSAERETIQGGGGHDAVFGGGGSDSIDGGDGNDLIDGQGAGDRLFGGYGNDTINGGDGPDWILYDTRDSYSYYFQQFGDDSIDGGAGDDLIEDPVGTNTLRGGDGDDRIKEYDGLLDGGEGNDSLLGTDGCTLLGGGGNDTLQGYSDPDGGVWLDGGDGDDLLRIGDGTNFIALSGQDTLLGGAGNDTLLSGRERDWLDGGEGDDSLDGGVDDDTITGGPGRDTIEAGLGDDSVVADADDLVLRLPHVGLYTDDHNISQLWVWGTYGDDVILITPKPGQPGIIQVNANGRLFECAASAITGYLQVNSDRGSDLVRIDQQVLVRTILTSGMADQRFPAPAEYGRDTFFGGGGTDYITGTMGDDLIDGGGGNDEISGHGGDDRIAGGSGNDSYLSGGEGDDTIEGGDGNDRLYGGPGSDSLDGGAGDDTIYGGDGDDTLIGGAGIDLLDGGAGNNTIIDDDRLIDEIGLRMDLDPRALS